MEIYRQWRFTAFTAFILMLASVLSACMSVRLISDYDEQTDKALTAIQQNTDDFIAKLIAKAPSTENAYAKNKKFYEDIDKQLRKLEFRVASIPNNKHTIELVEKIRASILGKGKCNVEGGSLRDMHCLPANATKGPSKRALEIVRRNINQTIRAALSLELAKKQGIEENK